MADRVTHKMLRAHARALGMSFYVTQAHAHPREMRINLKKVDGGTEATAYYTQDADDAMQTMIYMAKLRDRNKGLNKRCETDASHRGELIEYGTTDGSGDRIWLCPSCAAVQDGIKCGHCGGTMGDNGCVTPGCTGLRRIR